MAEPRRTFGPLVLVGLGGGTLATVAGTKVWAEPNVEQVAEVAAIAESSAQMPLATALGLVVLAAWGVVLVTRSRVRRAVAVLGALAAAGTLATVIAGYWILPDAVSRDFADYGVTVDADFTGWYWAALAGAVVSLVAVGLAVRWVPAWPEMGSRYDAPGAETTQPTVTPEDSSSLDLWKAMDEGRDPTA